jgi:hypothetical protein
MGIHQSFEPVLIYEGPEEIELLVVEGKIGPFKTRFFNAYGPQEDEEEKTIGFYSKLEEEIILALDDGCWILLQCDANAKLGNEIIKNAPNPQSPNGTLLWEIVQRNNLTVLNSLPLCEGTITRHRVTKVGEEKSVLDYFIVCDKLAQYVEKMVVDEDRIDVLTKFAGKKGTGKMVKSDHNLLSAYFNVQYDHIPKKIRTEVFDFKNTDSLEAFYKETSGDRLTKCFDSGRGIDENAEAFNKELSKIVSKCFKKVRIKKSKSKIDERLQKLDAMKKELVEKPTAVLQKEVEDLEFEIQQCCAAENSKKIRDQVSNLSSLDGGFSSNMMWQVKKKVIKKTSDPPMAKKDSHGNLVTAPNLLKDLYKEEYTYRLRHREIKPSLLTLKQLKEDLWSRRLRVLSEIPSDDWSLEDVQKVLTSMKNNKARDPLGYVNELFKPGVCGSDLSAAITLLVNGVKNEVCTPNIMKLNNISTIYKNKGSRFDLVNDRGIFNMVIFRKIVDRLIYNDKYECIDKNMSDSNVGGRKGRNIRNHLFMVYGIINSVLNNESPPYVAGGVNEQSL